MVVEGNDGGRVVLRKQEEGEAALHKRNSLAFVMTDSTPVCHGALIDLLGYLANVHTMMVILEVPPIDMDPAALLIFEKIAIIYKKLLLEKLVSR